MAIVFVSNIISHNITIIDIIIILDNYSSFRRSVKKAVNLPARAFGAGNWISTDTKVSSGARSANNGADS
jgi:hypothetical protein